MRRLKATSGSVRWADQLPRLAKWLDPVSALPAAPREAEAALDALAPSLMPHSAPLRGVAMGLSVLATRSTTGVFERLTRKALPGDAPLSAQLAARAALGGVGAGLAALRERDGEQLWVATVRSTGQLLRDGAAGWAVHDFGRWLQHRHPNRRAIEPTTVITAITAGLVYRAGRRGAAQGPAVEWRSLPQPTVLPGALATSSVVTMAGVGLARGFLRSRSALESYFGLEPSKRVFGRLVNIGLWSGAAAAAYMMGVAYVGRVNEKLEPAYATVPASPLVSGSADSLLPFDELGQEGRRFVTDVITPEMIEQVMGEPAVAHPIRAYVGFNSEPLYQTGRAELALAELERAGAFSRSVLLLVSPTGTGWVDQTMIEAAEFLTRGDIATCSIQYARYPSFLSIQKVALGRGQFRLLLWGVKQRLAGVSPEQRPRVLVFGESLGAWTSSDVVMFSGIKGFEHYGIDRALWVGMPWLAKWSRSGMTRGSHTLVPPGTVQVFDRHEQLAALGEEERARLRAVVLSHDNDPIAVFGPDLLVQRPAWLANGQRGRGVPDTMHWLPLVTFIQTGIDAMNTLVSEPGEFGSFGHDYRADMARFVREGYGLAGATDAQLTRIEEALRWLDLKRAEEGRGARADAVAPTRPPRSDDDNVRGGVPLRIRRTPGSRWAERHPSIPWKKTGMSDAFAGRSPESPTQE
jgi:uncharacterized membrane protein